MDWFICKAASTELVEPPSSEKISFRHAFLSSLQDKTAFLITTRFETVLKEAHASLFPLSHAGLSAPSLYSDPSMPLSLNFDSSVTPSPPRPPRDLTTQAHPLAPVNPSLLASTLAPVSNSSSQAPHPEPARRSQRQRELRDITHNLPLAGTPHPLPTTTHALPVTTYTRARSSLPSARHSRPDTDPPATLAAIGVLFGVHTPPHGRKGLGRS